MRATRGRALPCLLATCLLALGACRGDDDDVLSEGGLGDPTSSGPVDGSTSPPTTAAAATTVPSTRAAAPAPSFVEGPCPAVDAGAVTVRCGTVAVPLDHGDPGGAPIGLAVAVLTGPSADPTAAPIVLLGGGPGEVVVGPFLAGLRAGSPILALAAQRSLVLLDQRGVGASTPSLACPEVGEALAGAARAADVRSAALAGYTACHDRLVAEGIDLGAFDTPANSADVDLLRRALGHEQVVLFGNSYGTRLALDVVRRFPDTVESLVLSSPAPLEENYVQDAAASFDRALVALDAACAADVTCAASYPAVLATLQGVLADLARTPAEVEVTDPATGAATTVTVEAETVASLLFALFYVADGPVTAPHLVHAMAAGDFSWTTATGAALPADGGITQGMQASALCAEEAAQASPADLAPGEVGVGALVTRVNPVVGEGLWDVCGVWGVEPVDASLFEPVVTDVPALVVTGQFDPITPPAYGEQLATTLPDARYVEMPGVGHSPLLAAGECGITVMTAFLADPGAPAATGCAPEAPVFPTPEQLARAGAS